MQHSCPARSVCSAHNDKSASCLNSFQFLLAAPQVSGFSFKQAKETQKGVRGGSDTATVEIIIKMKQYKMGRASVCCGEPINVYDWAVTFYGFNEKSRRLRLAGGEGIETSKKTSKRKKKLWKFLDWFAIWSARLTGVAILAGLCGKCNRPWDFIPNMK